MHDVMSAKHRAVATHNTRKVLVAGTGAIAVVGFGGNVAAAQDSHDWSAVAECESSGDWSINTGNGYYGGLQFSDSTWDSYKPAGAPDRADQATQAQQIEAAEATLAAQGPGAWPVCGSKLTGGVTPGAESNAPALSEAPGIGNTCERVSPVSGPITSGYGPRNGGMHDGTDFGVPIGTPIHAVTSGTVSEAGFGNDPGGYGNYIQQEADSGESIQYGHVSEIYVAAGDYVDAGEVIGASGNAGSSSGPHLHLRVSSGDPIVYLEGACDVSETPIADEVQATIDNAPTPIHDDIEAEFGSWEALFDLNRDVVEDPDLIYPGEVLDLGNGSDYTVVPGDTLSGIAFRLG